MSAPLLMALGCIPHTCGRLPHLESDWSGWPTLHCRHCYDGAEDAGPQDYERAKTTAAVVEVWNDRMRDHMYEPPKELCGYLYCEEYHDHSEDAR